MRCLAAANMSGVKEEGIDCVQGWRQSGKTSGLSCALTLKVRNLAFDAAQTHKYVCLVNELFRNEGGRGENTQTHDSQY